MPSNQSSPSPLAPLAALKTLSKGLSAYFVTLISESDPVLRVGAWHALIDADAVVPRLHFLLLKDCVYGSVRPKAFDYFEKGAEHELAARAAAAQVPNVEAIRAARMKAQLEYDSVAGSAAEEALYLATGRVEHLIAMIAEAEVAAGWKGGAEAVARAFVAMPTNVLVLERLFMLLESASQTSLLAELAMHLRSANVFPHLADLADAIEAGLSGDAQGSLRRLDAMAKNAAYAKALKPFFGLVLKVRADALDRVGDYRDAATAFAALNAHDKQQASGVDPASFSKSVETGSKIAVPRLPDDPRTDVISMVGFPRSGTTLLENALNAHPLIETFEEIPARAAAVKHLERFILRKEDLGMSAETAALGARGKFYDEIERRRGKAGARVLINKFPLSSADARALFNLLPKHRHIFSIRHPFDVAFSCFRQRFRANPAMENFHSIPDVAKIYDFTMTQWFSVHSMEDPLVHYVRYEQLVTEFETTLGDVLGFLGLEWDDEVLSFAAKAEARAAQTPSYQKVRKGLAIGVQTSWRNYEFLFKTPEAKPLYKWAEFFGYPTK